MNGDHEHEPLADPAREGPVDAAGDQALAREVLRGDAAAVERFVVRLRCVPRMLSALNTRHGGRLGEHDLADLAQDVAILLWRKLDGFDPRATLDSWAFGIARYEYLNALRRLYARSIRHVDLAEAQEPAAERGVEALDACALAEALDALEPAVREVIRLKHYAGLTFEEIAVRLAISPNTAKTRYYRSLRRIHESWGP